MNIWKDGCMNEYLCERMNERMNEWMNIRPVDMPETPHLYPWVPP